MIYDERDIRKAQALDIAQKMLVAARTAPKGKGVDVVECAVVDGDDLEALARAMEVIGQERGHAFFLRDANCVRQSLCVALVCLIQCVLIRSMPLRICGSPQSEAASVLTALTMFEIDLVVNSRRRSPRTGGTSGSRSCGTGSGGSPCICL